MYTYIETAIFGRNLLTKLLNNIAWTESFDAVAPFTSNECRASTFDDVLSDGFSFSDGKWLEYADGKFRLELRTS